MKTKIEANRQDSDEKMKNLTEDPTSKVTPIMNQIKISKSSPDKKDWQNTQYPTIVIPNNKRASPLEVGNSKKIGGMWALKHEIISPKAYEILINTELKGKIALELKNFYNHIRMCLDVLTRLPEDLLTDYQPIKRHYEFEEYFVPDRDNLSYYLCLYLQLYWTLTVGGNE